MSLHPPKHISSMDGLGVNTSKQLDFMNESMAIGTEIWGKITEPWAESGTIIADQGYRWVTKWQAGKPYIITKFFDEKGELVGVYCDISRPVKRVEDGFAFDDLYLDVWMTPGKEPMILDEDELRAAVEARYIRRAEAERAMQTALVLVDGLKSGPSTLLDFS